MNFDFNGLLDKLRDAYREGKAPWGKCIALTVVLFAIDICVDIFVPTTGIWWTVLRTVLAAITSIPIFIIGYDLAWHQHDMNEEQARSKAEQEYDEDEEEGVMGDVETYLPYRLRYSPSQRLRQSLIFGAVLVVIAVITSYTPVYTLAASVIIACLVGIAAYCRLTPDEQKLKDAELPDPRDVMEDLDRKDKELEMEAEKELRREQIEERKKRMRRERRASGTEDEDDEDDEDYEDDDEDEDELSPREKRKADKKKRNAILFGNLV